MPKEIDKLFHEEVTFLQQLVGARSTNPFTASDSPPDAAVEEEVAHLIEDRLRQFGWSPTRHGLAPQ